MEAYQNTKLNSITTQDILSTKLISNRENNGTESHYKLNYVSFQLNVEPDAS